MPRGPGVGPKYNEVVIFRLRIFKLKYIKLKYHEHGGIQYTVHRIPHAQPASSLVLTYTSCLMYKNK